MPRTTPATSSRSAMKTIAAKKPVARKTASKPPVRRAKVDPVAVELVRNSLTAATEASVGDTISNEARLQHLCVTSADAAEGIAAFKEKRQARYE